MKLSIVPSSLSYASIREAHSQGIIINTYGYEKSGTPIISVDDLKAIGRIVQAIKAHIEVASTSISISNSFDAHLPDGSHAPISETGSADMAD